MVKEFLDEHEYREIVKSCIDNDTFFKDSYNWFLEKYVTIFSNRTITLVFLVISLCASLLNYRLVKREWDSPKSIPIITMEKDQTQYLPIIKKLDLDQVARSVDETILRELVQTYVINREKFDYQTGRISSYNDQLNNIKNNSTPKVFLDYKNFINSSPNSPIKYFGQAFKREIRVTSFNFIRNIKEHWLSHFLFFINTAGEISKQAVVSIEQIDTLPKQRITSRYNVYLSFSFNGISKNPITGTFVPIKFAVTQYSKVPATN